MKGPEAFPIENRSPEQQAKDLKDQKKALEIEIVDLAMTDPGSPVIDWKREQVQELEQMISKLEAVDLTDDARLETDDSEKQDKKAA